MTAAAHIIIADDNEGIRDLLSDHLGMRNHSVLAVNDGSQLAREARERPPHLIITDVQMPGSYGSSAYQVLQKDPKTSKIPLIFMSAHPREKLAKLLPDDPKTRFIQKPVALAQLDAMIAELLPLGGYVP